MIGFAGLRSGAFVESLLEEEERSRPAASRTVQAVLAEVAAEYDVPPGDILSLSRQRSVAAARQEFYRRAYRETRATMADLARYTGRTQPAVWQVLRSSAQEGHN